MHVSFMPLLNDQLPNSKFSKIETSIARNGEKQGKYRNIMIDRQSARCPIEI